MTTTEKQIKDAVVFLSRMQPHLIDGMTFEAAGRAVLADDAKLVAVATSDTEQGTLIRKEIAKQVFRKANAIVFKNKQAEQLAEKDRVCRLSIAHAQLVEN